MLTKYIATAMQKAIYDLLEDGTFTVKFLSVKVYGAMLRHLKLVAKICKTLWKDGLS